MLRTGKKYIDDLRTNQPTVYYGGKVVEDVASHPAFANSVRTTAEYYDLQKSSKSLHGYNSIVGGDTPISLIQPKNKSDLIKIRKGMQKVQEHFGGYFERSPNS